MDFSEKTPFPKDPFFPNPKFRVGGGNLRDLRKRAGQGPCIWEEKLRIKFRCGVKVRLYCKRALRIAEVVQQNKWGRWTCTFQM